MEIKNKEAFKAKLRAEIAKHIKEFPVYFYGNIIINILIVVLIIAAATTVALGLMALGENTSEDIAAIPIYGFAFISLLMWIFSITIKGFLKNVRILKAIRVGHYELKVEEYELDNTLQFIEKLPMSKEDVERIKVSLSFGKLVDVLDLFGIICCKESVYDMDIISRYELNESSETDDKEK
jgi:hypothetical protein